MNNTFLMSLLRKALMLYVYKRIQYMVKEDRKQLKHNFFRIDSWFAFMKEGRKEYMTGSAVIGK